LSSLSALRATIFNASSGNGRCSAFASSRGAYPDVTLLFRREDHRHCLRIDRLDHCVRCGRQEAIDEMRPRDRLRLGATITLELGPESTNSGRSSLSANQTNVLLRPRVRLRRVFGEAVGWDQAPALRFEPAPPMRRRGVANIGDRPARAAEAAFPSASSPVRARCPHCERQARDSRETRPWMPHRWLMTSGTKIYLQSLRASDRRCQAALRTRANGIG
jgi:hypothetical protein